MVLSSLFFLDLKGRVLISRDYRGDIDSSYAEEFINIITEREIEVESGENCGFKSNLNSDGVSNVQPPIFSKNGISYCYMKHNNLYCKLIIYYYSYFYCSVL